MIVRILGEGQFRLPDEERDALEALDRELLSAVNDHDHTAFHQALTALTDRVRRSGRELPTDEFAPSDLVVPYDDASLEETKALLADSSGADE